MRTELPSSTAAPTSAKFVPRRKPVHPEAHGNGRAGKGEHKWKRAQANAKVVNKTCSTRHRRTNTRWQLHWGTIRGGRSSGEVVGHKGEHEECRFLSTHPARSRRSCPLQPKTPNTTASHQPPHQCGRNNATQPDTRIISEHHISRPCNKQNELELGNFGLH